LAETDFPFLKIKISLEEVEWEWVAFSQQQPSDRVFPQRLCARRAGFSLAS